ncbi:MAG: PKD domain-containing protein [Bacteroidota bacterium]
MTSSLRTYLLTCLICCLGGNGLYAQPANDDCANATVITIPNNGFGYGTFTSDTISLVGATTQLGETFPAGVANGKSVWYRFSLPTTREVRILLDQTTNMPLSSAGWRLYRNTTCIPAQAEAIDPPIFNIEGFTHACLRKGDYLLQVGADLAANGDIFVSLIVAPPSAPEVEYDFAANPLDFQVLTGFSNISRNYEVGCQSIFDGEPMCPDTNYTKSTWHIFTTDNVVDMVRFTAREFPFNNANINARSFGYFLYEGDSRTDSTGLILVDGCDSMRQTSSNNFEAKFYPCMLKPNTTYSIKLMFPTDYFARIELNLQEIGSNLTAGPDPGALPASHEFGTIALGNTYQVTDYFACNARTSFYTCGNIIQDSVLIGSSQYDLNWWATFTLATQQDVEIWMDNLFSQPTVYWRLFQGDASASCNLTLQGTYSGRRLVPCLTPGTYSIQVLGTVNSPSWPYWRTSLGNSARLNVQSQLIANNAYGRWTPTDVDSVNGLQPLNPGTLTYATQAYFDCQQTPMPAGDSCRISASQPINDRAFYRVIRVANDGIITVDGGDWTRFRYKLFAGNAATNPVVGGIVQNLTDLSCCQSTYYAFKVCVTPGFYTLVTYGGEDDINYGDRPWVRLDTFPPTQYVTPATAERIDTLSATNTSVTATPTYFSCLDNPATILGYAPCNGATKLIYREFYLADSASLRFIDSYTRLNWPIGSAQHRLFRGRISTNSLTSLVRDCFTSFSMSACDFYEPGWYTVVSYGYGQTYTNPAYCSGHGESVGDLSGFSIQFNPPYQPPRFNTFAKADSVNNLNPIFWYPQSNHTPVIPKNDTIWTLATEYFDCNDDLPFPNGITACAAGHNRVSYRVFTLSKPTYLWINMSTSSTQSRLYQGDVTATAAPYTVVHDCFVDDLWMCIGPGTYSLVTFASDAMICRSLTPRLYLDSLGTSKYDHARNAYNFGSLPRDSVEYRAAVGAPTDILGRPASNDFIFCSTSAHSTDPKDVCPTGVSTLPYSVPNPTNPRQNLWYTFEVTGPGSVDITVYPMTPAKVTRLPFAIYRVDNNVVPITDSLTNNLTLVATSQSGFCPSQAQTVNIFRDPCAGVTTDRYVILVDRHAYWNGIYDSYHPNMQVQVGIRFSNIPGTSVLYDHYSQANAITANPTITCGPPYTFTPLSTGTFTGCEGNLTCATRDATDQNSCGNKTIWYKFDVLNSGLLKINYTRTDNNTTGYNANDIQLYREVIPGDSSSTGLQRIPLTSRYLNTNPTLPGFNFWGEACYTGGTYYVMITGCNFPNATVYPRVWLENLPGDFCSDSIGIDVTGPGVFRDSAIVDCWTIGESPGEDNTASMGCLGGPLGLKSGWFHISISDTQKMDLDINLTETTSATALEVKYRVANGRCSQMTFENCVDDGAFITLNLKCRQDSGLWIQVILPENATGQVRVNVVATPSTDQSCEPIDPFEPNASFDFVPACAGEPVPFQNQSTVGANLAYAWDFGDGFTSTQYQPTHTFFLPDTYLVSLVVQDSSGEADTSQRFIFIYPNPVPDFDMPDTLIAGTQASFLNLSSNTLSSATYYWDFCAGNGFCSASQLSFAGPNPPPVTYSSPGRYPVCLTVTNGNCDSTVCDTIEVVFVDFFSGGPYDGSDYDYIECEDTLNFFAGGPYDGFDVDNIRCPDTMASMYSGGPFDGHGEDAILLDCPTTSTIWAGGPFDGAGVATLEVDCNPINFFAGGPYDGFDKDEIDCVPINFFSGGPYDGFDVEKTGSIIVPWQDVCVGDSCTFRASSPTNWYSTKVGGTLLAANTDTYTTGPLTGTYQIFVDDVCTGGPERVPVVAHVTDSVKTDFGFSINCQNVMSFFASQSIVPGPSSTTIGTEVTAAGPVSTPPAIRQVAFSSSAYTSFPRLYDGNTGPLAWRCGNAVAKTVWVQWKYFVAKSVDRIQFTSYTNNPAKFPTGARLYYATTNGWELVKVFSQDELNTPNFDSGFFCEATSKYSRSWLMELDVADINAPEWSEFQVYGNEATTGGAVQWDFGDGSPIVTGSSVSHTFDSSLVYNVTLRANSTCGACASEITKPVTVPNCTVLPSLEQELVGELTTSGEAIDLDWIVTGEFDEAWLEKRMDGSWVQLNSFYDDDLPIYKYQDNEPLFVLDNIYRVRTRVDGLEFFSNIVTIQAKLPEKGLRLYPNPVNTNTVFLDVKLPEESDIRIEILNTYGQVVHYGNRDRFRGPRTYELPLEGLASGQYFVRVNIDDIPHVLRLMITD